MALGKGLVSVFEASIKQRATGTAASATCSGPVEKRQEISDCFTKQEAPATHFSEEAGDKLIKSGERWLFKTGFSL